MPGYRILSSDDHIIEQADLWTSRIEPKFRDQAPHVVREEDEDWWYCDDKKLISVVTGTQAGTRFEEPEKLSRADVFENVRPGGYVPEEHVKDMDADGIDVSIIYPSTGLVMYQVLDSELLSAIFRAYNDWLAEFCEPFPKRLKGVAMLNLDDVQDGVKELQRCANRGFAGAMIPAYIEARPYDSPEYEPLWAAAEDLEIPISLHAVTTRQAPGKQFAVTSTTLSNLVNIDHWVRMSLADITLSGVFDSHRKLQVGAVEHELAWIPHFVERLDYAYTQRPKRDTSYSFGDNMLPRDYIKKNVFYSFQEDALGIRLREIIGVDSLLWGSDYPHQEGTFPRTREILEEILADCTDDEKAKIVGGNAARVYHLE